MIRILEVTRLPENSQLWGFHLDSPRSGESSKTFSIVFTGWVLGKTSPVKQVEFVYEKKAIDKTEVNIFRPQVPKIYPEALQSEKSGFSKQITVKAKKSLVEDEIVVIAILENGERIPIAIAKFQCTLLESTYDPKLQPIMITSFGRFGTTMVAQLLSEHPQIITYQEYPYEVRFAQYWMDTLLKFNSFISASYNEFYRNPNYSQIFNTPEIKLQLESQLKPQLWLDALSFCQQSIDGFYLDLAQKKNTQTNSLRLVRHEDCNDSSIKYFLEKFSPDFNGVRQKTKEVYPGAKEIILVRDPRDAFCSIINFNKKRNQESFGRENFDSDESFIQNGLKPAYLQLLKVWKQAVGNELFLVRYEDLINKPLEIGHNLLEYCGVDSSDQTIEFIVKKTFFNTKSLGIHQTSPSVQKSVGRWQYELSDFLKEACDQAFQEFLEEFGYV